MHARYLLASKISNNRELRIGCSTNTSKYVCLHASTTTIAVMPHHCVDGLRLLTDTLDSLDFQKLAIFVQISSAEPLAKELKKCSCPAGQGPSKIFVVAARSNFDTRGLDTTIDFTVKARGL